MMPAVIVGSVLAGLTASVLWWRRRRTIRANMRVFEWHEPVEFRYRPSWQIDVNARPMEVGKDID